MFNIDWTYLKNYEYFKKYKLFMSSTLFLFVSVILKLLRIFPWLPESKRPYE